MIDVVSNLEIRQEIKLQLSKYSHQRNTYKVIDIVMKFSSVLSDEEIKQILIDYHTQFDLVGFEHKTIYDVIHSYSYRSAIFYSNPSDVVARFDRIFKI